MSETGKASGGSRVTKRTPLYDQHVSLGAKMVVFAGYDMPVQYPAGIVAEHNHTRAKASLFDVSHMGQISVWGAAGAQALEALVPGDIEGLAPWAMRYTQLTSEAGGILDDLMVVRAGSRLLLIVNAARKEADLAHLRSGLEHGCDAAMLDQRVLIALQGPAAAAVMARHVPDSETIAFMTARPLSLAGVDAIISRSGYTGEDGFEISVAAEAAARVWARLIHEPEVAAAGLGARDSLRLEAGLCLYGHDIGEDTSPVEAGLAWSIGKRRRGESDFPGARRILEELIEGPKRKRVGIRPEGRAPAREGTEILDAGNATVGEISSGGFGPSVGGPVAMGYVEAGCAALDTALSLMVRGTPRPARVVALPFVKHNYHKP